MNHLLLKSATRLHENYKNVENPSYVDYFIFLKVLISIVELSRKGTFNEGYWHIYNAAKDFLNFPPNKENEHNIAGLKRELDFTISNLVHYLKQNNSCEDL